MRGARVRGQAAGGRAGPDGGGDPGRGGSQEFGRKKDEAENVKSAAQEKKDELAPHAVQGRDQAGRRPWISRALAHVLISVLSFTIG